MQLREVYEPELRGSVRAGGVWELRLTRDLSHLEGGQGPGGSDKWSRGLTSGPAPQAAEEEPRPQSRTWVTGEKYAPM